MLYKCDLPKNVFKQLQKKSLKPTEENPSMEGRKPLVDKDIALFAHMIEITAI